MLFRQSESILIEQLLCFVEEKIYIFFSSVFQNIVVVVLTVFPLFFEHYLTALSSEVGLSI